MDFICQLPSIALQVGTGDDYFLNEFNVATGAKMVIAFYGSVVLHALSKVPKVNENLLTRLLPFIIEGLKSKSQDYQTSSFMIISQIARNTALSDITLDTLINTIINYSTEFSHAGNASTDSFSNSLFLVRLSIKGNQTDCGYCCILSEFDFDNSSNNSL
jgi:hypothetical protein